ncbi:MAG: pyruvate carboxylase subunit B, partial [Fimbriimonadaceae bacterium]
MPRLVEVTDVILRDAHQSLMATRMGIDDMIPVCEDLDNAGYWSLECWGGATFDSCIRFLNEDPWERLRTFKRLMPKTPLQMLLRGQNILGYRHYEDTVVDRFVEKAAENGMDVFRVFDAVNDVRNLERALKAVKRTGKHAQGTICYTISPVHTVEKFVEMAQRLKEMGVDSICIKDMAALLKPQPAYDIVKSIKEKCGEDTLVHVHCHSTSGVTMVSLMKAVEAGADIVDTAVSSISLGPGHNPTESFVEMLEGTPYTTRLDLERIYRVRDHFAKVRPRYKEFLSEVTGVETEIFASQIPGGMLSNMESQLKQQGAGDKMREVLEEVPRVRKASGYPPLVTPTSQIVGT